MAKWFIAAKKADFQAIAEKYHIDPVIARIIRNRDVITDSEIDRYLNGTIEDLPNPCLMKDLEKAADILCEKIAQKKKIRIIGDYDVDGICSTYILYKGFLVLGAQADTVIPHRIRDGYGLNEQLINDAIEDEIDTIVTCDNGIAAANVILHAKEKGLTCIVTDHHEVPYEETKDGRRDYMIPSADAVVDPKQEDCTYPFQTICGAVVALKLIEVLFLKCRADKALVHATLRELTELAGVATVCDVMELKDENRILVKTALRYMKDSANLGLKALIKVNDIMPEHLSAYHLGFVIGPCMNATGRLDTAQMALELLKSKTFEEAVTLAVQLKELNNSRKEMTRLGVEEACAKVESGEYGQDKILVLYLPDIHESLAGIIAGRVREKYGKPTFVLTRGEDGVKGSARSIDSYHIYEEMTKCKELFTKYGGHKMAAGLSMPEENVAVFRKKINEICMLTEEDFEEKILIDVPMPMSYVNLPFVKQLAILEPFGTGNEKPVFAQKAISFVQGRRMGNGNMAKFLVRDENMHQYTMLLFHGLDAFETYVSDKFGKEALQYLFSDSGSDNLKKIKMDVLYYPSINEYRGKQNLQFVLQGYQ
ncbi:MAG: single-stranded-DNA-specific exonuclease RecJ [Lachnospiraceae bacterium]